MVAMNMVRVHTYNEELMVVIYVAHEKTRVEAKQNCANCLYQYHMSVSIRDTRWKVKVQPAALWFSRTVNPHLAAAEFFQAEVQPHNKYSAHLPHSTSKYPDFGRHPCHHPCHHPSKSVTSFSVAVVGSALFDNIKPKVRRQRQHRSRSSKVFPLNARASSCQRSQVTYRFSF